MSLHINNLSFSYGHNNVLSHITTDFKSGEVSIIAGPNGSGKSTLVKLIMSQLHSPKGSIFLNNRDIHGIKSLERARMVGYVPQHSIYDFDYTVFEIVEMGRYPYKNQYNKELDRKHIERALSLTDVTQFSNRKISQLSGGELQRVLLARALTVEPEFLILDEPGSNLDISHNVEMMELIYSLTKTLNMTTVIIVHDLNAMLHYGDSVLFLKEGRKSLYGSIDRLMNPTIIKDIFNIDTQILEDKNGKKHLVTI